jgi:hypothetical protein
VGCRWIRIFYRILKTRGHDDPSSVCQRILGDEEPCDLFKGRVVADFLLCSVASRMAGLRVK